MRWGGRGGSRLSTAAPLGFTCQAGWFREQDVAAGAGPGSLGDHEDMWREGSPARLCCALGRREWQQIFDPRGKGQDPSDQRGSSRIRQAEIPGATCGLPDTDTGVRPPGLLLVCDLGRAQAPGQGLRRQSKNGRRGPALWTWPGHRGTSSAAKPQRASDGPFSALIKPEIDFRGWGGTV